MAGVMMARLEAMLLDAAHERRMMTYREVARGLEIKPPHTIHKAALLIEALMRCHAEAGVPQLASLIISRVRGGLPAPGYFLLLQELNLFDGDGEGEVARTYHENEVHRCFDANGSVNPRNLHLADPQLNADWQRTTPLSAIQPVSE